MMKVCLLYCWDAAMSLHNKLPKSPSGSLVTALTCAYLDAASISRTPKVYLPDCNFPKDSWKSTLKKFNRKIGYDLNSSGDGPSL